MKRERRIAEDAAAEKRELVPPEDRHAVAPHQDQRESDVQERPEEDHLLNGEAGRELLDQVGHDGEKENARSI